MGTFLVPTERRPGTASVFVEPQPFYDRTRHPAGRDFTMAASRPATAVDAGEDDLDDGGGGWDEDEEGAAAEEQPQPAAEFWEQLKL